MSKEINLTAEVLKQKGEFTTESLAQKYEVEVNKVADVLDTLIENGFGFTKVDNIYLRTKAQEGTSMFNTRSLFKGGLLHFAIVSDPHLCSKYERLDALEAMYDKAEREGITTVFNNGDLTDGVGVYTGQEFELKVLGQEGQIDYAIKNYPKRKGITTYVLAGNHDLKETERGGCNPLIQIARARKDIVYVGAYSARIKMDRKVVMDMLHPLGSQCYALSYKSQRNINAMAPDDLPNILTYGHYHNALYMNYRGIQFIQAPCFKDPSPQFEKRLGFATNIGGWIVDAKSNGESVHDFKPRLITYKNRGR